MSLTKPSLAYQDKNPIAVGNQISVEKDSYISTGVVSYVEGDILEIELADAKLYQKGEPVKLTVYSAKGFQILTSSVIALDEGVLTVINPPENQRLSSRRQYARVQVDDTGRIRTLRRTMDGPDLLDEPRSILIRNLSVGGVGFLLRDAKGVHQSMLADIEIDTIKGIIPCTIEITRKQRLEDGVHMIGAKFADIDPEHLNTLRGYILRIQIKNRARMRKNKVKQ